MPLIPSMPTALRHIDSEPSGAARKAADALVKQTLSAESLTTEHPLLPFLSAAKFSDLVEQEHDRIAQGKPKDGGVDLSRYEALDAPERGQTAEWKAALQKAYASVEYLRGRETNLGLLETYGKNAWLIGNSQLEDILKPLEKEVEGAKIELEAVEQSRRAIQQNAASEMQSLDEGWRKGVGKMLETQAAAESLRLEILDKRRHIAS